MVVSADGAYNTHPIHQTIAMKVAIALISSRKNAVLRQHGNCKAYEKQRDEIFCKIKRNGRKIKSESGYHQRRLAENTLFIFNQLLSQKLRC